MYIQVRPRIPLLITWLRTVIKGEDLTHRRRKMCKNAFYESLDGELNPFS